MYQNHLRNQLLCGVAAAAILVAVSGTTLAADLPVYKASPRPEPVVPLTWTGFYIGGHIGTGQSKWDTTAYIDDPLRGLFNNKPGGIVGGMQAGYNWQYDSFVFGLEGDVSATGWNNHTFMGTTNRGIQNSVQLLASLRGRLGFAFGPALLYGTGGIAYTKAKYMAHSPGGTINGFGKIDKWGYVLGGGVDWKINRNFSIRGEGLYYNFDTARYFGTDHIWMNKYKDAWVARVGVNYHFQ